MLIDRLISKSLLFRNKAVDLQKKAILITNFYGSIQEGDLSIPPNCNGFGRIRHFHLNAGSDWISNPLPILPAVKALKLTPQNELRTQVFQIAVCNWNCWYCFVDSDLRIASKSHSSFLTCDEMLTLYLQQNDHPQVIDLTGGQPDLAPEWILWMMEELTRKGLQDKVFLWSDDNLSNDFIHEFLTDDQLSYIANYRMYARVCCFKGIDEKSFVLNTKAPPELFEFQFAQCKRLIEIGLDLFCYLTLPSITSTNYEMLMPKFFDKLQNINEMLPLRVVPLKIFEYSPVLKNYDSLHQDMLLGQFKALEIWKFELSKRFSKEFLNTPITEIKL